MLEQQNSLRNRSGNENFEARRAQERPQGHKTDLLGCSNGERAILHLRPRAPRAQERPGEPWRAQVRPRGHKTGFPGCSNGERAILEGPLEHLRPRVPRAQERPGEPQRAQERPHGPGSQKGSSRLQQWRKGHSGGVPGAPAAESTESPERPGEPRKAQKRSQGHKTGLLGCSNGERAVLEGSLEHLRPSSAESPGEAR
jgi:hypothetical protein